MSVSLEEIKSYLRVDCDDDDALLETLLQTACTLCADAARIDKEELYKKRSVSMKTAVLYAVAYLYEHREEADHHALQLTLRALLSGQREAAF